jgi:hypothetical protein
MGKIMPFHITSFSVQELGNLPKLEKQPGISTGKPENMASGLLGKGAAKILCHSTGKSR